MEGRGVGLLDLLQDDGQNLLRAYSSAGDWLPLRLGLRSDRQQERERKRAKMINKAGVSRTECGFEVEESIVRELILQGFPEDITRKVLSSYNIDGILFDSIMRNASIEIDNQHKGERE